MRSCIIGCACFSPTLTASLKDLATQIPQLKKDIQDGLLKSLSLILMKQPLRHPGAPKQLPSPSPAHSVSSQSMSSSTTGAMTSSSDGSDVTGIVLALHTLGSFDFEGHSLTQFVRHCADCYLSHDFKDIRIEAVRTCSQLLNPSLTVRVKTLTGPPSGHPNLY